MTECMFIKFLEDDSDLDSLNCIVQERYVDQIWHIWLPDVFTCGDFLFFCF